jgi:cyanophycinase
MDGVFLAAESRAKAEIPGEMTRGFFVDEGASSPKNQEELTMKLSLQNDEASGHRWIYAVGGGDRDPVGIRRAVEHARATFGSEVRAIVIAYASEHPESYLESFSTQLSQESVAVPDSLLRGPTDEAGIADAARRIRQATLICLSGGDQNVAMQFFRIPALREALHERYRAGAPFIATSAGTALLTRQMMTGDGAQTADGLGLLDGFVLEQHFVTCDREPRVVELLRTTDVEWVIGPDEDAMLEIRDEALAEVIGRQYVFIFEKRPKGIERYALSPGDRLDLKTREPLLREGERITREPALSTPLTRRTSGSGRSEAAGW